MKNNVIGFVFHQFKMSQLLYKWCDNQLYLGQISSDFFSFRDAQNNSQEKFKEFVQRFFSQFSFHLNYSRHI